MSDDTPPAPPGPAPGGNAAAAHDAAGRGASPEGATAGGDAFDLVVGQPDAVAQLRAAVARPVHAYLFVGPPGSGARAAARAFAAELLAFGSDGDAAARHRRLALAEAHPDLEVVEREGPAISRDQARTVVERAARSPVESARKVIVLTEFHLVLDAAPVLLKTIEEPPASTVFLVLADEVPPEIVTVASRCVVVRFGPLPAAVVVARLVEEGVAPADAERAAEAAGGDLDRARLLAADPHLAERMQAWRELPRRLDGTGAAAAAAVADLLARLDAALAPVEARQRAELAELVERDKRFGLSNAGQKRVEARHRRERRRLRQDELRSGLAVLSRAYRDDLLAAERAATASDVERFGAIQAAAEALERNPNESLLLQALLCRLRPLEGEPASGRRASRPAGPRRRGA